MSSAEWGKRPSEVSGLRGLTAEGELAAVTVAATPTEAMTLHWSDKTPPNCRAHLNEQVRVGGGRQLLFE